MLDKRKHSFIEESGNPGEKVDSCPKEPTPLCFCFLFFFNFIYLFLAVLGLRLCARAFSSCGERGPLFIAVRGPLTVAAQGLSNESSISLFILGR